MSLFKKLDYDPVKDFAPITRFGTTSFMLMVRPIFPAKNAQGVHGARQDAAGQALGRLRLRRLAGFGGDAEALGKLDVVEVPYKGIPQTITDTMGGSLHFTFVDLANALAQQKGGKLRGLAVTSAKRSRARARPAGDRRGAAGLRDHRLVRAGGARRDARSRSCSA